MNKTQRIILLLTAAVLIAMILFPPFYYTNGIVKVNKGYRFILNPIKMAYWDKEAELQAAKSFDKYIISDKGRASLSDQGSKLNFDFMLDPRWATLDTATKNAVLDIAFEGYTSTEPEWSKESPDIKAATKRIFLEDAFKAEQKLKRIRDIYLDGEKKKYPKMIESVPPLVDTFQLLAQAIIVILVGGILWLAFKDEKKLAGILNRVASDETSRLSPSEAMPVEHQNDTAKRGDRSTTGISRHLWRAMLGGKNRAYYEGKFDQFDKKLAKYQIGWNWPAFLGGGVWALYRKMYGWFFISLIVNVFFKSFYKAVYKGDEYQLVAIFFFNECVNIAFALFANSLYQNNLRKKIIKARSATEDEAGLLERLRYQGGVHTSVIWASIALPIIGILLAIMIPKFVGR